MPSPAELGFSMPPEWEPHAATWTSWPFDDVLWEGQLEGVRDDMAGLVATVARYESVVVNVRDEEAERDAHRRLAALAAPQERIAFHRLPLNDAWFRDNGPIFVRDAAGRVALTDWRFNAWGGKYAPWDDDDRAPRVVARRLRMQRFEIPYVMEGGSLEVNGEGVCLTTRSCLLARERNPELDEHEVETLLRRTLGVRHVVWLEGALEGDHTDGHIDTLVRFADDRTIVCALEEDVEDPNHGPTRHNLEALRSLRAHDGTPYRVVALPLPRRRMELGGTRLPPSYANFYIGNGFVVVPLYEDENDEAALTTLRPLFPGRDVIGLGSTHLITGGGAFHCVTQQQPAGEPAPEDAPGG
ncbi:MAG: agmatine deiminase family protein [Deinococcales bacterium]